MAPLRWKTTIPGQPARPSRRDGAVFTHAVARGTPGIRGSPTEAGAWRSTSAAPLRHGRLLRRGGPPVTMPAMDTATLAMMAATAVGERRVRFRLGQAPGACGRPAGAGPAAPDHHDRDERPGGRRRVHRAKGDSGMDEATRTRLAAATQSAGADFRRAWQGHAAVMPGQVVAALWAVDDAYRQLTDPSPAERTAFAGFAVLNAARDGAMRAVRADAKPDVQQVLRVSWTRGACPLVAGSGRTSVVAAGLTLHARGLPIDG